MLERGRFTLRIGSSSRDIRTEVSIIVTSSPPAFSLQTPWIDVQPYEKDAAIVANIIGNEETNTWKWTTHTASGWRWVSLISCSPNLPAGLRYVKDSVVASKASRTM